MKQAHYQTYRCRISGILPLLAVLAFAGPAQGAVTVQSYWSLGENPADPGEDLSTLNDGMANPFNNHLGTVWNSDTPSGVNGSTVYGSTSGVDYQGIWMFGEGSQAQVIPESDWGVQFMVRSTAHDLVGLNDFRSVFGMAEGVEGGLVIEIANIEGRVHWEVNKQKVENYIIPRNEITTVTFDWTNLALVNNGGVMEFYVNGILAGSNADPVTTSGLLAFGLQQNVGTKGFRGDFDEASFFTFEAGAFNPATDLIPEPSALLLGGLGLAGMLRRRRTGGSGR